MKFGIVRAESFEETRKLDDKFELVEIINAPEGYISVSNNQGKTLGYLVDISLLKDSPSFGKGTVATNGKAEFDKDDVFVYDKNGTVYYVKGFDSHDGDRIYYNATVFKLK